MTFSFRKVKSSVFKWSELEQNCSISLDYFTQNNLYPSHIFLIRPIIDPTLENIMLDAIVQILDRFSNGSTNHVTATIPNLD